MEDKDFNKLISAVTSRTPSKTNMQRSTIEQQYHDADPQLKQYLKLRKQIGDMEDKLLQMFN